MPTRPALGIVERHREVYVVISIALSVAFDWIGTRAAKSCSYEFTLAFTLRAQHTIIVSLQWRRGEARRVKAKGTRRRQEGGERRA
jgi:hypothetical protein